MIAVKYKYEKVVDQIRKLIEDGTYDDRLPSVRVLAGTFGVNNRTVMKALEELENERLVYTDSTRGVMVAKGPAAKPKSGIINIIYPSGFVIEGKIEDHGLIRELSVLLTAKGYRPIVTMQCEAVMDNRMYWANNPCDGYILISFKEKEALSWHRIISKLQLPAVYFCNILGTQKNYNWVDFDNVDAMRELFARLEKAGHRRIAYAEANHASHQRDERMAWYKDFLEKSKTPLPGYFFDRTIDESIVNREELNRAHEQFVEDYARQLLAGGAPPTAVYFFFNHPEPLIRVFAEAGLKLKRDYIVILKKMFFEDAPPVREDFPTILANCTTATEKMVDKLLNSIENPRAPLSGELIPAEFDMIHDEDLYLRVKI